MVKTYEVIYTNNGERLKALIHGTFSQFLDYLERMGQICEIVSFNENFEFSYAVDLTKIQPPKPISYYKRKKDKETF